ncbi:PilN domain-containing protein [Lysobacter sp. H21R4]|uniref:PilN domain-containing protein n=1 Tax=Lysobacter sp. H21R4 TaxID=2781021 RepID=UPI0018885462|nr:PilN domain-containing protein [Lysobacter sp. H21R4]QOY63278.1 PilN domain-containing protein [Lysobacter sp. H21R4]
MARINLLPWRAERRKQRQKDTMMLLALSALGAVVLSFLIIWYHNAQIEGQTERNDYLTAQIAEVDKKIEEIDELDRKKSQLLARKEVIEELQANRSQMVHLFDSLVRTIPDGVVLTSIKQDNETLTLEGRSQSNARVSTYMRNLEGSGWMTRPELSIIEAKGFEQGLPYEFKLQVKLANPSAPSDEDGDGIADGPIAQAEPAVDGVAVPAAATITPLSDAARGEDAADLAAPADETSEDAAEPVDAPESGAAS